MPTSDVAREAGCSPALVSMVGQVQRLRQYRYRTWPADKLAATLAWHEQLAGDLRAELARRGIQEERCSL